MQLDLNEYRKGRIYNGIARYIAERYIDGTSPSGRPLSDEQIAVSRAHGARLDGDELEPLPVQSCEPSIRPMRRVGKKYGDIDDRMSELEDGFSAMLLKMIDESGMSDVECYKRACIDKRIFSKIRSNPEYHPSKGTAFSFAIALKLPLERAEALLACAGYAISHSSKFDLIVEYFIENGIYDIDEINTALYSYDMPLLGSM